MVTQSKGSQLKTKSPVGLFSHSSLVSNVRHYAKFSRCSLADNCELAITRLARADLAWVMTSIIHSSLSKNFIADIIKHRELNEVRNGQETVLACANNS